MVDLVHDYIAKDHGGSTCGAVGESADSQRGRYYADNSDRATAGGGFAGLCSVASIAGESAVWPKLRGVEV